jgi:hypothetical protein
MDALDLVTVVVAVLALGLCATAAVVSARLLRAARDLEAATAAFTDHALPAIEELRTAAHDARGQVDRVDALVEVAGAIGDRVDTATEATYRALTSPVIKGVALASGTRRAAQRLRGRDEPRRASTGARR